MVSKNLKKIFDRNFFSKLFDELFTLNRSIIGEGYVESLNILNQYLDMKYYKFQSGKKIFDWKIPKEWVIDDGYILTPKKKKICEFKQNNLHIMSYSKNVNKNFSLNELQKVLFSLRDLPEAIPYTTTYYKKDYGFNINHNQRKKLKSGNYKAVIKSRFKKSHLVIGEKILKGSTNKDFLISSYLCHPSMANNELSGPLVLLGLFKKISNWPKRNLNYNFLINPETIGSLCYLYKNKKTIKKKLVGGLVLTCLGGPKNKISFKKAKQESTGINKYFEYFAKKGLFKIREYSPITGSDERQYCSPGFNLPVGQASRTIYREYKEYHTSLDNKEFLDINKIIKSIDELNSFLFVFDKISGKIVRKNKFGEVFLSKYKLYNNKNSNHLTKAIIYILSCTEKENELIDVMIKKNLEISHILEAIKILEEKKIIKIIK
tara:strand:+ start:496 stop:1794 length:1299 start_codon:yes stop_codon:yes gene_type:complete